MKLVKLPCLSLPITDYSLPLLETEVSVLLSKKNKAGSDFIEPKLLEVCKIKEKV